MIITQRVETGPMLLAVLLPSLEIRWLSHSRQHTDGTPARPIRFRRG
jgi:hypothetical protein